MAKWTDDLHRVFVELCAVEVLKGNRVGSTLSKEGWSMVEKEFTRLTKMAYTHKQFKNHWEKMKGEYKIFKKLKWGESGLGWNEATKTIDAAPILWLQMIQLEWAIMCKVCTIFVSESRTTHPTLNFRTHEMAFTDSVQLQRIIVENNHGEKLVGILHETGSKELVIICHGFRSSKERIPMVNLAAAFANKGISAFRFDFSGNGESEGSFQYGNYRREADELRDVVEFFHAKKRLISAVIGHSKGGNVVLLYASKYSDVSTVVNISGRFNLERGIEGRLGKDFFKRIKQSGFIDVKDRRGNIEYRVTEASLVDRLTTDMRPVSCGIQQNCRVLTVHGSKDEMIPVKDAMEFGKYIANHRMFVIERADHEYTSHQDELASVVLDFVSQSCKDESVPEQLSCRKSEKIVHSRI